MSNEQLEKLLSIHGDVELTKVDDDSTIVTFKDKDHVIKTFSEVQIDLELRRRWTSLPPHSEILNEYESPIENLSDDCLSVLFSYLPITDRLNIERVCKRWRKIGSEGWPDIKKLGIQSPNTFTERQLLTIFQRCGRFVTELDFPLNSTNYYIELIEKYCDKLEKMFFFTKQKNHKYLLKILRHCKQIKSFTVIRSISNQLNQYVQILQPEIVNELHFYPREFVSGDERPYAPDLSNFINLQYLELTYYIIDENNFRCFEDLKDLKILSLQCSEISLNLIYLISNFLELEVLSLSNIDCEIDDSCIINIVKRCKKLQYLHLNNLQKLTDNSLKEISQLENLEFLELYNQPYFTSDGIISLSKVKTLSCLGCTGLDHTDGLIQLIQRSSNITYICANLLAFHPNHLQIANDIFEKQKDRIPLEIRLMNCLSSERNKIQKEDFKCDNICSSLTLYIFDR